jgi:hypothetical protein
MAGPEGGLTGKEVKEAEASGFIPVSLGKRILRTETASIISVGLIRYELGSEGLKIREKITSRLFDVRPYLHTMNGPYSRPQKGYLLQDRGLFKKLKTIVGNTTPAALSPPPVKRRKKPLQKRLTEAARHAPRRNRPLPRISPSLSAV